MNKFVLLSINIMIMVFLTNMSSYVNAASGDITSTSEVVASSGSEDGFKIDSVTVTDDRNISLVFSDDLAREPLNLEIIDESGIVTPINSITIGTGATDSISTEYMTGTRQEVQVFTAKKLEPNKKYFVVVKNARSMNGIVIEQDKVEILLDKEILEDQEVVTDENLEKSDISKDGEKLKTDTTINENLKRLSEEKFNETAVKLESAPGLDGDNSVVSKDNKVNTDNIKALPKTGPSIFIMFFLSLFLGIVILSFLKKKNI
ncbi:MAG: hypothetical protein PHS92_00655 [Candidatus Gracilibacteria bacterium]|nr:hypothetical protein [Candidatus Gracilibacteria bacterium]